MSSKTKKQKQKSKIITKRYKKSNLSENDLTEDNTKIKYLDTIKRNHKRCRHCLSEVYWINMSLAQETIEGIFKIKIRPSLDSLTDQYHRTFMVKLLLISSLVMGIHWFNDSISCLAVGMSTLRGFYFVKFFEYVLRNQLHPKDVYIKDIKRTFF